MKTAKTISFKIEKILQTSVSKALSAWLDPKNPGTPWHESSDLIFKPKNNECFYFLHSGGAPHYGRFIEIKSTGVIRHTWMSPMTQGFESEVVIFFKKQGNVTLMTLTHSGLPDSNSKEIHASGWSYYLEYFSKNFQPRRKTVVTNKKNKSIN